MTTQRPVLFSVPGVVTVELRSATVGDVRAVTAQLGTPVETLAEPDIVVRFVDRVRPDRPLTIVGHGEAGYDSSSFYILRTSGNRSQRVRVPFEAIGGHCEITCEHGVPAVPLLVAIVNLTALAHGVLPLHASAVRLHGRTLLVTGWSKGGKTETVLALAALGGAYVADEWTYVLPDGSIVGLPEPIRLWAWHLDQLPAIRRRLLSPATRARLTLLRMLGETLLRIGRRHDGGVAGVLRRMQPIVARQANVRLPPSDLFDGRLVHGGSRLDIALLAQTHDAPDTIVEPIAGAQIASRMVHSLAHERNAFMALYYHQRLATTEAA